MAGLLGGRRRAASLGAPGSRPRVFQTVSGYDDAFRVLEAQLLAGGPSPERWGPPGAGGGASGAWRYQPTLDGIAVPGRLYRPGGPRPAAPAPPARFGPYAWEPAAAAAPSAPELDMPPVEPALAPPPAASAAGAAPAAASQELHREACREPDAPAAAPEAQRPRLRFEGTSTYRDNFRVACGAAQPQEEKLHAPPQSEGVQRPRFEATSLFREDYRAPPPEALRAAFPDHGVRPSSAGAAAARGRPRFEGLSSYRDAYRAFDQAPPEGAQARAQREGGASPAVQSRPRLEAVSQSVEDFQAPPPKQLDKTTNTHKNATKQITTDNMSKQYNKAE